MNVSLSIGKFGSGDGVMWLEVVRRLEKIWIFRGVFYFIEFGIYGCLFLLYLGSSDIYLRVFVILYVFSR